MALWLHYPFSKTDLEKYEKSFSHTVQQSSAFQDCVQLGLNRGIPFLYNSVSLLCFLNNSSSKNLEEIINETENQTDENQLWINDDLDENGGNLVHYISLQKTGEILSILKTARAEFGSLMESEFHPKQEVLSKLLSNQDKFLSEIDKEDRSQEFVARLEQIDILIDFFEKSKSLNAPVIYD
jgi:hypothetical protein